MADKKMIYSYSSRENEEINEILKKYLPEQETDSAAKSIKKIDRSVTGRAAAAGITAGIIGVLVFGFGMSCVLVWQETLFAVGVLTGILGIAIAATAHPLYKYVLKKERQKAAPAILRLAKPLNNTGKEETK